MRLLIVSKSFPPLQSARALQIGKVVEALRGSGCQATVIAGRTDSCGLETTTDEVIYLRHQRSSHGRVLLQHMPKRILGEFASCWPRSYWVQSAIIQAIDMVSEQKADCLMTSSTPFESHLVGLAVKRKTGIPWVASFSDPWPAAILPRPYNRARVPLLWRVQKHWLRQVLEECDLVHMPSKYGIELAQRASGIAVMEKAEAIPHIGCSQPANNGHEYCHWLAHVGHLTPERVSAPLLAAIQKVHEEMPQFFHGLLCVGSVCSEFKKRVGSLGLQDLVKVTGHVSQREACSIASGSGALLVIEADMDVSPFLPSKFADYAVTGRSILAITPEVSAIRDYFGLLGGGMAVGHDVEQIADGLRNIFGQVSSDNRTEAPHRVLEKAFSPPVVSSQYMKMLHLLVSESPEGK